MLATRMARLENENRRLKRAGGVVVAAGLAVILGGQARPTADIVEATEFRLVDAEGNVCAWLAMPEDEWSEGDVALGFVTRDGELRTALGVIGGHPRIQFGTELEDIRLAVGLEGNMNDPSVQFIGRNDVSAFPTTRMSLGLANDGAPGIRMWGNDGEAQLVTGADDITFYDGDGRERLALSLGARSSEVRINEPDQERLVRLSTERIAIGSSGEGPGFEITPAGFRGFSFWSGSDREDAHASLWVPTDELSDGPRLSVMHVDRGWLDIGFDRDGLLSLLANGRRIYFGEDGHVLWEPEP